MLELGVLMFYDPDSMKYNTFPQHRFAEMGEACTKAVPYSPIFFFFKLAGYYGIY